MKIVWVRRISQLFFLLLFLWFCVVTTWGTNWWQLRGWPVNAFLNIDPLAALGTLLTSRTFFAGLWWALGVVVLTIVLGRVFCSWVCPLGSLLHFVGYLGRFRQNLTQKVMKNAYRKAQAVKYYILFFVLSMAVLGLVVPFFRTAALASLQTGLLDPICLFHRSVNLALLPFVDRVSPVISITPRNYEGALWIAMIFLAAICANLWIPRFYCRFVCPLGALLGVFGRFALWRIGKKTHECSMCLQCETHCEGACEPSGRIRQSECVVCMNCLRVCDDDTISFQTRRSLAGEVSGPDITRRGFIISAVSGLITVPMIRLSDRLGMNWNPRLIRPPGSAAEPDFLNRCIKCGQCMRICPTNIIQPAGLEMGLEAVWTPTLNFRIGTSGCALTCVACGQICPTTAIRPLQLDEKLGRGVFAERGPVRLGTAFVDHNRCLPWCMDRPCIVCQENCPVSPKAIFTRDCFSPIRLQLPPISRGDELTLDFGQPALQPDLYTSGDYFCNLTGGKDGKPRQIVDNTAATIVIDSNQPWDPAPVPGSHVEILIRLQQPYVDPALCIGCGICEHVCPISGLRAIRVTAENETRDSRRSFLT